VLLNAKIDRFAEQLIARGLSPLHRRSPTTLQINMGKLCNQNCRHCHVDAGPNRTELMDRATTERVLEVIAASPALTTIDITGGAPELNPNFRTLVTGLCALKRSVMVRCNLTVLSEKGQEDTASFYAQHGVKIVASLPCYTQGNVDSQRGRGVFDKSIHHLQALNGFGYGASEGEPQGVGDVPPLRLDLVFNPGGPTLPPAQESLERDYRVRLTEDFGIRFDRLLAVANMPIHRFSRDLQQAGQLQAYEQLLEDSFNEDALENVMCRDMISVDWDGSLADCDFNQMLDMPLGHAARTIYDLLDFAELANAPVTTASHCLGCTAGQGSSCGGAITRTSDD
jgi:radical SAM/Cys-rich protein